MPIDQLVDALTIEDICRRVRGNKAVARAFRKWYSPDAIGDEESREIRIVRAILNAIAIPPIQVYHSPDVQQKDSDLIMTMVEWNGRLAEAIVAQADQLVELHKLLNERLPKILTV